MFKTLHFWGSFCICALLSLSLSAQYDICLGEFAFLPEPPLGPASPGGCPPMCVDCGTLSISPTTNATAVPGGFNVSPTVTTEYTVTRTYPGGPGSPPCPSESATFLVTVSDCTPTETQYCESSGNSTAFEWIQEVQFACTDMETGNDNGYFISEDYPRSLPKGQSFDITLTPGFSGSPYVEKWAVWIDFNQDNDFLDEGEWVLSETNSEAIVSSIAIPANALSGTTRMRIAMSFANITGPCGAFAEGEVEDYTIDIVASGNGLGAYCETSGQGDLEWISNVLFGGFSNASNSNCGYGDYTNRELNFVKEEVYSFTLTPDYVSPYNEYWQIYIDLNQNSTFDPNELVYDSGSASPDPVNGQLTVPVSALNGESRMRIVMSWVSAVGACAAPASFFGEVEDYTVNIEEAIQPPVAGFSFDPPAGGDAPLTVQFTDASTNNPDVYQWTFTGPVATPSSSTEANPTVIFEQAGTYQIQLLVSNAIASDVATAEIVVTEAVLPPVPNFYASTTEVIEMTTIVFTNTSTNNPTSLEWTFEGGNPATASGPGPHAVIYNTSGMYDVALQASNVSGTAIEFKEDYITVNPANLPPVPLFTANQSTIYSGENVVFTSQSQNEPTSYQWSFPGGNPSSANTAGPHIVNYDTPGTYDVSLIVTNDAGSNVLTQEDLITVTEQILPPIADFNSNETEISTGESIIITSTSSNEPTTYQWSFPGGNPSSANTEGPHIVNYDTPGTYDISLIVTNEAGSDLMTKEDFITVSADGLPPTANFIASQTSINTFQPITFTELSNNLPDTWEWIFTGAATPNATGPGPHTTFYENEGIYSVSLTVTNAFGNDVELKNDYITVIDATGLEELGIASLALSPNPSNGQVNLTIKTQELASYHLYLSDVSGKILWEAQTMPSQEIVQPIHLHDFANGLYFISIQNEESKVIKKIILQK